MLYGGIDEAGYGPMFGPLCAGVAVFEIPDLADGGLPCLWQTLDRVVVRGRRDTRDRIAINDSKKLKGSHGKAHPLTWLERGVLTFASTIEENGHWLDALDDQHLLDTLGIEPLHGQWYNSTTDLPLGRTVEQLRIDRNRLCRCFDDAQMRCVWVGGRAIGAAEFNQRVETAGSKAIVNWEQIVALIERCWIRADGRPLILAIDRQGGRMRYLADLGLAWPSAHRRVMTETPEASHYILSLQGRGPLELRFEAQADQRHLPVALASMTAKYARELLMLRLNRFFMSHLPDLAPTAGYVQDGRRYLREIEPVIETTGITVQDLVRSC